MRKFYKNRGFTLTELAIVLGVIGVIMGAIWVAASTVSANQKAEKMTQEITTIVANMRNSWPNGHFDPGSYWFDALAVNNNIIPQLITCPASYPWGRNAAGVCGTNPYGTQVIVGTQTGVSGSTPSVNSFEININALTPAQCQSWLPGFVQLARANGLTYAGSAAGDGISITSTTAITQFQSCSGDVALQFNL